MYTSFDLEKILEQCERAAQSGLDQELLWDWGKTWTLLGKNSGEISDFKQAVEKFAQAAELGCELPAFLIDSGEALVSLGLIQGNPQHLENALGIFDRADAWGEYACTTKHLLQLTHTQENVDLANHAFRDAILADGEAVDLWLEWGELHLHIAWLRQDKTAAEAALEKLSSSKISECEPQRATALIGTALCMMGSLLEDLKMIREGKAHIMQTLELEPENPYLLHAAGRAHLTTGDYFSDEEAFTLAASFFKEALFYESTHVENWYGLYHAYLKWGLLLEDHQLVKKGLGALAHLCELRPFSLHYHNEWGVMLIKTRELYPSVLEQTEKAIVSLQKAASLGKGDLEPLYHLGSAYDVLGDLTGQEEDYQRAVELLSQVFTRLPQNTLVAYHLGVALVHLGEVKGHVGSLFQAVKLLSRVAQYNSEEERVFAVCGYASLLLSELIYDAVLPERSLKLRREAEKHLLHAAELGHRGANYHLACLYSLAGLVETSLLFLHRAEEAGALPPPHRLDEEVWLERVRDTIEFQELKKRWEGRDG